MLKTGLEFANGTTEDCQKLVLRLFDPNNLLIGYKQARQAYKTGDLVLVTNVNDARVEAWPRLKYIEQLRVSMGRNAETMLSSLRMTTDSAHKIVSMPADSDAFWLWIIRGKDTPIMVVMYASPYEVLAPNDPAPAIGEA